MAVKQKCRHVRSGAAPNACACAWYSEFRDETGKVVIVNAGHDRRSAEAAHRRNLADAWAARIVVGAGTVGPRTASVPDVTERYLAAARTRGLSPRSLTSYEHTARKVSELCANLTIHDLNDPDMLVQVADMIRSSPYALNVQRTIWNRVLAVLGQGLAEGLIDYVAKPRVAQKWKVEKRSMLPVETLLTLVDTLAARDYGKLGLWGDLAAFVLETGLRREEF